MSSPQRQGHEAANTGEEKSGQSIVNAKRKAEHYDYNWIGHVLRSTGRDAVRCGGRFSKPRDWIFCFGPVIPLCLSLMRFTFAISGTSCLRVFSL